MRIILSLLLFLITSCSGRYDKYIGFWIVEERDGIIFLEIYKNNNYYIHVNVHAGFENKNIYNEINNINGMLNKNHHQFIFIDDLNIYSLVLSRENDKLYFFGKVFSRIHQDILINKIEQFNRCQELESSYKKEKEQIGYGWVTLINPKYKKMQNKIQNCNFID